MSEQEMNRESMSKLKSFTLRELHFNERTRKEQREHELVSNSPSAKTLGLWCPRFTERPRRVVIHLKSLSIFSNDIMKFGRSTSR